MLYSIYNAILYQPLYNLLVFLYNILPGHDIGLAIIVITILIRLALLPFTKSQLKSQKSMQDLQPKLDALKAQYKGDKEKMGQEMMKLYKDEKVNPLASCLPLLVQLPIFIALYHVFQSGLSASTFELLYPFVKNPGQLNPITAGILDLSKASIILAVLAGVGQFFQTRMLLAKRPPAEALATASKDGAGATGAKDEDMMAMVNKQMMYVMPVMTVVIGWKLPAGLALYWIVTTLVSIAQQYFVLNKKPDGSGSAGGSVGGYAGGSKSPVSGAPVVSSGS